MLKEFKDFIARGNVMDLAVGVIIGAAFTAIVKSLVANIINPFIGLFLGKIDFSELIFSVGNAHFKYGLFINSIINFLIIALVVFLMVKMINKLMVKKEEVVEATPTAEEAYLKEIVELLKHNDNSDASAKS